MNKAGVMIGISCIIMDRTVKSRTKMLIPTNARHPFFAFSASLFLFAISCIYFLYFLYSVNDSPVPFRPVVKRIPFRPKVMFKKREVNVNDMFLLLKLRNTLGQMRILRQKRI